MGRDALTTREGIARLCDADRRSLSPSYHDFANRITIREVQYMHSLTQEVITMTHHTEEAAATQTPQPEVSGRITTVLAGSVEDRIRDALVLTSVNKPARDYYGAVLTVDRILQDLEPRTIGTIQAFKTAFHTVEEGWLDTYSAACYGFGRQVLDAARGETFSIRVVFSGQITKWGKKENRETDTVRLA